VEREVEIYEFNFETMKADGWKNNESAMLRKHYTGRKNLSFVGGVE
jgi:hypothetical protein